MVTDISYSSECDGAHNIPRGLQYVTSNQDLEHFTLWNSFQVTNLVWTLEFEVGILSLLKTFGNSQGYFVHLLILLHSQPPHIHTFLYFLSECPMLEISAYITHWIKVRNFYIKTSCSFNVSNFHLCIHWVIQQTFFQHPLSA